MSDAIEAAKMLIGAQYRHSSQEIPAIAAALEAWKQAGVRDGIEMAAQWHERQERACREQGNEFDRRRMSDEARTFWIMADRHRSSAVAIRALVPAPEGKAC